MYSKLLLVGDFNAEDSESCMSAFLYQHNLKNLVKQKTFFKSTENPSCIDLFLTNCAHSFQNTNTISAGISDCHKMVVTVLKTTFTKAKPKEIFYRSYKNFNNISFRENLRNELSCGNVVNYSDFQLIFMHVLNNYAPLKKKLIRANNTSYMTKTIRKAIMTSSFLEHKYYKHPLAENNKTYKKTEKLL